MRPLDNSRSLRTLVELLESAAVVRGRQSRLSPVKMVMVRKMKERRGQVREEKTLVMKLPMSRAKVKGEERGAGHEWTERRSRGRMSWVKGSRRGPVILPFPPSCGN